MVHGGKREGAGRPKGGGAYGTSTRAIRVPINLVEDVKNFSLKKGYKIPLFSSTVAAGYPSSAEDHIEEMIDMNSYLIKNPETTFCVKVSGLSMIDAGINEGDILVVDSSVRVSSGRIIVVALDGMLTVKRLAFIEGKPCLMPENPEFHPIPILENSDVKIWGVVTSVLRNL
jgi:DNA polymerase V